jgi:hypothetical protein
MLLSAPTPHVLDLTPPSEVVFYLPILALGNDRNEQNTATWKITVSHPEFSDSCTRYRKVVSAGTIKNTFQSTMRLYLHGVIVVYF